MVIGDPAQSENLTITKSEIPWLHFFPIAFQLIEGSKTDSEKYS